MFSSEGTLLRVHRHHPGPDRLRRCRREQRLDVLRDRAVRRLRGRLADLKRDRRSSPTAPSTRCGSATSRTRTSLGRASLCVISVRQPSRPHSRFEFVERQDLPRHGHQRRRLAVAGSAASAASTSRDRPTRQVMATTRTLATTTGSTCGSAARSFTGTHTVTRPTIEFAFNYKKYNAENDREDFTPQNLTYVELDSTRGLKDEENYLWNDEYTINDAGSPNPGEAEGTGLKNIYELDTLRAGRLPEATKSGTKFNDVNGDGDQGRQRDRPGELGHQRLRRRRRRQPRAGRIQRSAPPPPTPPTEPAPTAST